MEFTDTAQIIGRVYDALRTGTSAARELYELQRHGAITGQQRNYIEGLNSVQQGAEAWKELQKALMRYDGMLKTLSFTWEARMEKFKDAIEEAMRQFGVPLMEGLKPYLETLTKVIFSMAPKFNEFGKKFSDGLKTGINVLVTAFTDPGKLIDPFILSLRAGIYGVANVLFSAFSAATQTVFSKAFFTNVASGFWGLSKVIAGQLMVAFQGPVAFFLASIEKGVEMATNLKKATQQEYQKGLQEILRKALGMPGNQDNGLAEGQTSRNGAVTRMTTGEMGKAGINTITAKSKTFEELVSKWMSGGLKEASSKMIAEGEGQLAGSSKSVLGDLARNFKVRDVFGAGKALKDAASALQESAKVGESVMSKAASVVAHASSVVSSAISGKGTTGFKSSLQTGGLYSPRLAAPGALGASARQGSLLKWRERAEFENQRVAAQMAVGARNVRKGSSASPGGYNRVRRGDRQRMQEVQRERLREKAGVDKTNQLLERIMVRFDELTRA